MPERRREAAQHLVQSGSLSISQACRLTRLPRRSWYRPDPVQRRLERPHESLGNLPPSEFKRRVTAKVSSYELCA